MTALAKTMHVAIDSVFSVSVILGIKVSMEVLTGVLVTGVMPE